jgi:hypothetical protein
MEPFHFTLASEDHNLYTFDMRKLDHAITVHNDHVSAVLAVDYSPTGRQVRPPPTETAKRGPRTRTCEARAMHPPSASAPSPDRLA